VAAKIDNHMKKAGLLAVLISFFISGCTEKNTEPAISAEFLTQTGWEGVCTEGDAIIGHFVVLFRNDSNGVVYYNIHQDKPSSHDNVTYSLTDGRMLTIADLPDELSFLSGEWILTQARDDHIGFAHAASDARVLELTRTNEVL